MKNKTKLLVTILSLCLTIALFTFSVYAATQVSYQVKGSVTYRIRDVLETITTSISKADTHQGFNSANLPTSDNIYVEEELFDEFCTYSNNQIYQDEEYSPNKPIIVDFNESSLWRVSIEIETINEGIIIEALDDFSISSSSNYGITPRNGDEEIYEDESTTFRYYIYLKDPTKSIPTTSTFNISLILSLM